MKLAKQLIKIPNKSVPFLLFTNAFNRFRFKYLVLKDLNLALQSLQSSNLGHFCDGSVSSVGSNTLLEATGGSEILSDSEVTSGGSEATTCAKE